MGKVLGREVDEISYPDSDGKPMAETDIHRKAMIDLIERLTLRYAGRNDVYVTGNLLVYYVEGKPTFCLAPDCFVAFGVPPGDRRSFKTWEEGAFPSVVFEVTSDRTEAEDTQTKFAVYRDVWKVRELFYFDPTGDYLDEPLIGYRLARGKFQPIRPGAGRLTSAEIGVTLEARETRLVVRDGQTGDELPRPGDADLRAEVERLKAELAALKARPAN
jgi:Uma2 family endonuclease